jgi:hypothetical protein
MVKHQQNWKQVACSRLSSKSDPKLEALNSTPPIKFLWLLVAKMQNLHHQKHYGWH